MTSHWMRAFLPCLILGHAFLAMGEQAPSPDLSDSSDLSSPERVQIISINQRVMATHPPVIDVLPGERVLLRADVMQYGNACPHPEGCPEGRSAEEFSWSADDREGDECGARNPEACRDRTQFEADGLGMVFHIPYAMGQNITITVTSGNLSSKDVIVLHNAHLQTLTPPSQVAGATTPPGFYGDEHDDQPSYPTLAPSGIDEPYCGPYYSYAPCWDPYVYAWGWAPYYPYYSGAWWGGGWGWGGPGWAVGIGWGFGPGWWGGWHPWGWYGGYHPFVYGYHSGWWRAGYVSRPRGLPAAAPFNRGVSPPFAARPMGPEMRPAPNYRGQRHLRRGGWR